MLDLDDFSATVLSAWNIHVNGSPLQVLALKLRSVKRALILLNKSVGNLTSNVDQARNLLHDTQRAIETNPFDPNLLSLQKVQSDSLWSALIREEKLLKQKSRITWLKEGDKNSKFFFNQVNRRWNSNKILSLEDEDGVLRHGQKEIQDIVMHHFENLLGTTSPAHSLGLTNLHIPFGQTVSREAAAILDKEVTDNEIIEVLKSMKKNKSPGPDGFNVNFFLHSWHIVGSDFLAAIKSFFLQGCLLQGTNSTAIALVPKVPNPNSIHDFRPISCCNTTYKCISKIIANRLKLVLPSIISPFHSAFIPGRSISDNILIAQELFRNYHRHVGPSRCALKIDFRKAFDSVSWDFILEALRLFGFPPKFLFWIKSCITSSRFSVKINGALCGYFKGAKGLRQGDPLSPYLFLIAMEVLSLILNKGTLAPSFKFHWKTKQLGLTHLCFADDLIIFCHGDIRSVNIIKSCLDDFSTISGLLVNQSKSQCFLSNVPADNVEAIINCLGFQLGNLPAKFLGLPLISSKLSLADCQPLLHRIRNRIQCWNNRFLSYAGRLQLISSVLFSIQSFWSSHFLLPASIINEIKCYLSRFLWKGNVSDKHGAKVSWKKICLPFNEGGLKLKSLDDWNKAMILLKLWQVVNPVCLVDLMG